MSEQSIDLLPPDTHLRVRGIRSRIAAVRTALALVAIAVMAGVAAELVRVEALDRETSARAEADRAWRVIESRVTLERDVRALVDEIRAKRLADARPGAATIVAAIAERLPARAVVDRIDLQTEGADLYGTIEGTAEGADGAGFAARLAALSGVVGVHYTEPSPGVFTVRFVVPLDPPAMSVVLGEVDDVDD